MNEFLLTIKLGENDETLWSFLQTVPVEEWGDLFKKALHLYLKENPQLTEKSEPEARVKAEEDTNAEDHEKATLNKWSLEELFIAPQGTDLTKDNQAAPILGAQEKLHESQKQEQHQQKPPLHDKPVSPNNPLEHLFSLIGEEEDPEVLKFFQSSPPLEAAEAAKDSSEKPEDSGLPEEQHSEPRLEITPGQSELKVPGGSKGLDFLLKHVIGEEDDPEVLKFFRP